MTANVIFDGERANCNGLMLLFSSALKIISYKRKRERNKPYNGKLCSSTAAAMPTFENVGKMLTPSLRNFSHSMKYEVMLYVHRAQLPRKIVFFVFRASDLSLLNV